MELDSGGKGFTKWPLKLGRTAVKPDSRLPRIFVAKFLCIIKFIIVIG